MNCPEHHILKGRASIARATRGHLIEKLKEGRKCQLANRARVLPAEEAKAPNGIKEVNDDLEVDDKPEVLVLPDPNSEEEPPKDERSPQQQVRNTHWMVSAGLPRV